MLNGGDGTSSYKVSLVRSCTVVVLSWRGDFLADYKTKRVGEGYRQCVGCMTTSLSRRGAFANRKQKSLFPVHKWVVIV